MSVISASGKPTSERRDGEAGAEQADGQEAGGDDAPPTGDLDAVPGETEQRRQQGDGRHHRDGDGGRGADAEARHELQTR